ncbi:hypothetical protein Tco_1502531 [Tanacetum coccineum]
MEVLKLQKAVEDFNRTTTTTKGVLHLEADPRPGIVVRNSLSFYCSYIALQPFHLLHNQLHLLPFQNKASIGPRDTGGPLPHTGTNPVVSEKHSSTLTHSELSKHTQGKECGNKREGMERSSSRGAVPDSQIRTRSILLGAYPQSDSSSRPLQGEEVHFTGGWVEGCRGDYFFGLPEVELDKSAIRSGFALITNKLGSTAGCDIHCILIVSRLPYLGSVRLNSWFGVSEMVYWTSYGEEGVKFPVWKLRRPYVRSALQYWAWPVREEILPVDQVLVYVAEGLILERQKTKEEMEQMIAKAILQERENIQVEISSQIQKAIDNQIPSQVDASVRSNQEQVDDYDFWTDSYASNDDEIPTKQVSQDIMEELSLTIDEAKLKKMADETLRQIRTSGDEHQYHIDQMKNFLKSDIVWEILVFPHLRKTTPLVRSCQRDPEAPTLSLINQDLLYLKKGSSWPEKIVLSLHKFPAIIFNDDDIEERTSRWVNKCVKKFTPYARYGVEHWKNPHAKIFYIRKQKEPGKLKEEIYSNSKIIQVIKTYWKLGHEHNFITEIVARRANECIVSITEPDYKNLNKNDIEDMYLLIMNGKVTN